MPPMEFELAVPGSEWPQNLVFDRSATGIDRQETILPNSCTEVALYIFSRNTIFI